MAKCSIEIYLHDLKPEVEAQVREFLNISGCDNFDIMPMFILEVGSDEEEEE